MKKLGGKSFWIILVISITSLILLVLGIIFLTKENAKEFYSAGYIISSNASKTDKYYFDENTVYKENVLGEYVFKDANNKEVSTGKDNFIHYLDNSLSFMKNGVILDLDNFDNNIVPYYNITDKSIIKYNGGRYNIETSDKTLIFNNFLGRIDENKYIVVGSDISVKLAGNETPVSGNYFEIMFVENGIVKVENQEGSYQTVGDGTTVFVGDKIKINLGDKAVLYGDETKLSLTEMTIDGNENIDIVPNGVIKEEDKNNNPNGQDGNGSENSGNEGTGTDGSGNADNGNGQDGDATGGNDQNGEDNNQTVLKQEVSVDLITGSAGINSISASFQVIDTADFIKGNLILTLTNTTNGSRVYTKELANVTDIQDVNISSLSPDCNYIMTIYDSGNNTAYFQKVFKTESLDLKLKRGLVTTDLLSYSLDFGANSEIKSANISLYDEEGKQIGESRTIDNETSSVTFDGLTHNTNYNVLVDSVIFNNTNYADIYTISTSDVTLKNKPTVGEISVDTDNEAQIFTLPLPEVTDEDNSIVSYNYYVYKAEDLSIDTMNTATPVYQTEITKEKINSENIKNLTLRVGENNITGKQNYRYKIVVVYNDNYKYGEIETTYSDNFIVIGKPSVEFKEELVDFNQIVGTIKIRDESCTIPIEGRSCFDQGNKFTIRYYGGQNTTKIPIEGVTFDPEKLEYHLALNGLTENTSYTFEVYAAVDLHEGSGIKEDSYIGGFTVTTSGIEALKMQNWTQKESTFDLPINISTSMIPTVIESDYGDKLATLTFNLYRGDVKNGMQSEPIATVVETENIKEKYYNKDFSLTSSFFGINSLDELRELSGGKLNRYYTLEVTDAYDSEGINEFTIMDNMFVFETPSILLLEDEVAMPEIVAEEITNLQMKSGEFEKYAPENNQALGKYDYTLEDSIVRGYKVTALFDKSKIESYFQGSNPVTKLNFYAYDSADRQVGEVHIDLTKENEYTAYFFLLNGTEYDVVDEKMTRGNTYKFTYDISIDTNNDGEDDELFPSNRPVSDEYTSVKQDPKFNLYIDNSTENSLTYKYKILDYDNAIYKRDGTYKIYYKIKDDPEEYFAEITKDNNFNTFTIENLTNSSIYTLDYYRASTKNSNGILKISLGSYYFDGYYDANDYNLGFRLEYGNFDNRLKIVIPNNDFLNRISAYLLTLKAGDKEYSKVITNLIEYDEENKYIVIDYADIADFKGKDIKVSLVAFYDTGFIGFSNPTRLGVYLKDLGLVDEANQSKVGYVYQTTNTTVPGNYVYVNNGAFLGSTTPKGILGYDLNTSLSNWQLSMSNLVNIADQSFINYGTITKNTNVQITQNGIYEVSASSNKYTFNPKVLDKANIQTEDDNFKFTSITPKVSSTVKPLINGATIDINLSVDSETLANDFVKTDGKYKFYIDIYTKNVCADGEEDCSEELVFLKTIETDYDNLNDITFEGLAPDSQYYYKISANMNKNDETVKTPLFDYNRSGYVEYVNTFNTLNKDAIFQRVDVNYTSGDKDMIIYSKRVLNITSRLLTKTNFNIRYELYNPEDELKYTYTVLNEDIEEKGGTFSAPYVEDITGNDFVFGNDYYTLKIIAVTTDLNLELELYNSKLRNAFGVDVGELDSPIFTVTPEAFIEEKDGTYNYGIRYSIVLKDIDRVINDGIYHIELQDAAYNNACPGHESDCTRTIDIKRDNFNITEVFNNLTPDTNYVIYIYADTYRNNVSLTEKESVVYVRKGQYTKNNLNFSLGAVTPTAATKNKLVITFAGAANLEHTLKKIDYDIAVQGGAKVASGSYTIGTDINFKKDKDNYPTLEISMPDGKELGLNNYILITYYIDDGNGNLTKLEINGKTVHQYTVKDASS